MLLNCASKYTPNYGEYLRVIIIVRDRYPQLAISYSDHILDLFSAFGALHWRVRN